MLTIQNYVKANTLEEAYELNQARNSRILGGMMWLRLGNARIKTAIDLSGLGLDQIEETDRVFKSVQCVRSASWRRTRDCGIFWAIQWQSRCVTLFGYIPESGNCGRKHLWKIWIFGYFDLVSGFGHICRIV